MRGRIPDPNEIFGQHLRTLRRERKLTQEALAERANLGVNIVGRLERALIAPGLVTLLKLSLALGIPAKELLEPFTPDIVSRMKVGASQPASSQR